MGFSTFQWRSKHKMMKLALFACLAAAAIAEPEPWTVYGGYGGYAAGYYPSTYGYGVSRSYGYPYSTYSHGVYGKREAEAESEAEADPQYLTSYRAGYTAPVAYSNYGYSYPSTYGYGLHNYGYSRFGYHFYDILIDYGRNPQLPSSMYQVTTGSVFSSEAEKSALFRKTVRIKLLQ